MESFALDASGLRRTLRDGDLLRVYPLSPRFDNAVTLRGNVGRPERYAWHDGMRISDLIPNQRFDCGFRFDCGDEDGVRSLLLRLLEHPDEIEEKGKNGREAFIESYDKPAGVARVMHALGLETQNAS
ncbi:MAG: hypothetical protein WCF30_15610 [Terracidiphilus sp.]